MYICLVAIVSTPITAVIGTYGTPIMMGTFNNFVGARGIACRFNNAHLQNSTMHNYYGPELPPRKMNPQISDTYISMNPTLCIRKEDWRIHYSA